MKTPLRLNCERVLARANVTFDPRPRPGQRGGLVGLIDAPTGYVWTSTGRHTYAVATPVRADGYREVIAALTPGFRRCAADEAGTCRVCAAFRADEAFVAAARAALAAEREEASC